MENISHLLHTHWLCIGVFLLSYLVKSILFLSGNQEKFIAFKKKTIALESIFATGFLVTGIWMLVILQKTTGGEWMAQNGWFHLKLTLVVIAIPLGIVGFKKQNKVMAGVSLLFFLYVLGVALTKSAIIF